MIPESLQQFARELAALAEKHGLRNLGGHFDPPFGCEWRERVEFYWTQGRHGADAGHINLTSTQRVGVKVAPSSETEK